ncbi:unnamed protein product [Rhodiola kirilowii]
MITAALRPRLDSVIALFVTVHPHETSALLHSSSCFFFILSSYFVVLPLRDEGAISLGVSNLPILFVGSLVLTLVAVPLSTLLFSLPSLPKVKDSVSSAAPIKEELKVGVNQATDAQHASWGNHGLLYISVRIGLFLWIALLNLITISSTWARIIDVMDNESGSRLFGFIGAGATLGQLCGSIFAATMAWLGPYLLLVAAVLMELAAQSSIGIKRDTTHLPEELSPISNGESKDQEPNMSAALSSKGPSPRSRNLMEKPQLWAVLDGIRLILSSTYLLYVSLFLWLSAVVSSFFYFQKVTINSFTALFIVLGQLTVTGRILTVAGVTAAICSAPSVAFLNLIAVAVWPTWLVVAISETLRKVVSYVVTRPGRELLFTVVSQEEKYKAKICIDVIVQRLGDATAAGLYKILFSTLHGRTSTVSLYALPLCVLWIVTGFHLGRRQSQLAKYQTITAF